MDKYEVIARFLREFDDSADCFTYDQCDVKIRRYYLTTAAALLQQLENVGMTVAPLEPTEGQIGAAYCAMQSTPTATWKAMKADGKTPKEIFAAKMIARYKAMLSTLPKRSRFG